MFEEVQHRQQGPQARRERGQRVLDAAFHLPTAEADERRSRGVRPGVLAAGDAPHRGAGHRGHPQPPGDCRRRFLLPGLDLLSAGLQQLEQLLDVPAPVVPQRDCLRVDLGWNIRQQEPRRQNPAIRRADFREHQPQGRRRARNPLAVSGPGAVPRRGSTRPPSPPRIDEPGSRDGERPARRETSPVHAIPSGSSRTVSRCRRTRPDDRRPAPETGAPPHASRDNGRPNRPRRR